MAETTSTTEELSREEVAAYLHSLSEEFETGDAVEIEVGNKMVTLQPPAQIDCETTVTEESSGMLSSEQETIELSLTWEPQE